MKSFAPYVAVLGLSSLLGCAGNFNSTPSVVPAAGIVLNGSVHGGQQPLTGSHIYLFSTGKTGYGSAATSMLNTLLPTVSKDTAGNGYVTSDSTGSFTITADYVCGNASDQVYLLAVGGNPGLAAGTNNSAIALMNALGSCGALNPATFISINELSTVAAATALAQFYVDPTHVGTSTGNPAGLTNAFSTAVNMVDTGGGPARKTTRPGNGTVPQATLHTLANILAACVNTSDANSTPCQSLFLFATPSGGALTDTLSAAVAIALNPTRNVNALYSLSNASAPFQPSLAAAPADFSVGISYTLGAPVSIPGYLAIDAAGDVWISSNVSQNIPGSTDVIIKLGPDGTVLSGSGFTDGGFVQNPEGLAIDDTGAVFVANSPSTILKLNNDGTRATGFPFFGGNYPQGIALDKSGRAWFTNFGNFGDGNTITLISSGGSLLTTITPPNFSGAQGIEVDQFNNVWAAGQATSNLIKIGSDFSIKSGTGAGFTGGGLHNPTGIAIDNNVRVWTTNSGYGDGTATVSLFNNDGSPVSSSAFASGARGYLNIIAMDGTSTAWTASCGPNCVGGAAVDSLLHFGTDGKLLNGTKGFVNPTFNSPQAVAIDASGNVWVGNAASGTVTQMVGVAAPVKTPIQAALKTNALGNRP